MDKVVVGTLKEHLAVVFYEDADRKSGQDGLLVHCGALKDRFKGSWICSITGKRCSACDNGFRKPCEQPIVHASFDLDEKWWEKIPNVNITQYATGNNYILRTIDTSLVRLFQKEKDFTDTYLDILEIIDKTLFSCDKEDGQ